MPTDAGTESDQWSLEASLQRRHGAAVARLRLEVEPFDGVFPFPLPVAPPQGRRPEALRRL